MVEGADGARGEGAIPSGIVTFLLTDVEGSTRLWAEDNEAMSASLETHDRVLREAFESRGGYVFTTAGDSFAVAFSRASDAVAAAGAAQAALGSAAWPGPALGVRMGVHLGEAKERGGDYFGPVVNLTARLEAAGHGGQVLLTEPVRLAADVAATDLGVHELRDVAEPVQVWQLGDGEFPALRVVDASLTNLPAAATKLVGRSKDIVRVRETLGGSRVVTLTAGGGTGKTRLAVGVGEEELPHRPDGVWFVDLTPVTDGALVGPAVASGLGLSLIAGDPFEQIVDYLADKDLLLIVDNCEHLIDECAEFAELLVARSGRSALLATSRERLDVAGEQVLQIHPLSVEGDEGSAAVELFAQRAAAVNSEFAITEQNRPVVAQLCSRLDGMPLAIELAAARSTVLTPLELLAGIEDRFALLGGGRRRQRQRTLEATLDWSYNLCDSEEQRLLRTLGVFVGGFDLGAVAAVGDIEPTVAVNLIESLEAQSLVIHDEIDGLSRYRLFETTSAYAAQRLADLGEAVEVRNRHIDHFHRLAMRHPLAMWADLRAQKLLGADRANLTAAFGWATTQNEWTIAAELLLGAFTVYNPHPTEGIDLVDRCVHHLGDEANDLTSRLMSNQWFLHSLVSNHQPAARIMRRLRQSPSPLHQITGHCILSFFLVLVDIEKAAELVEQAHNALEALPTGPDATQAAAFCETAASFLALFRRDPTEAIRHARAATQLHDDSGITSEFSVQASMSEAVGLLMVNEPQAALAATSRYAETPSGMGIGDEVRALAYIALDDLEQARGAALDHARVAVTGRIALQAGDSLLVLAALAAKSDRSTAADLLLGMGMSRTPYTQAYARHLADQLGIATELEAAQQMMTNDPDGVILRTKNAEDIQTLRREMARLGWH